MSLLVDICDELKDCKTTTRLLFDYFDNYDKSNLWINTKSKSITAKEATKNGADIWAVSGLACAILEQTKHSDINLNPRKPK